MSDPRAESLPESELRVVLTVGGHHAVPQYRILRHGREVARLDLAIEETKTAIEYDGRWHEDAKQRLLDEARRERLVAEGWRFVIVTADKLAGDYRLILDEVREARRGR